MSTPTIVPFASTTSASAATSAQGQLAGNFQTFLQLLTTQLQYQDPMSPMDTNQFTQQLVEFAGVQQSIDTNQNLESLVSLTTASSNANAASYIGREVTAGGEMATLAAGGSADWHYTLPSNAQTSTISVLDSQGNVVYSTGGETAQGGHDFSWNGLTTNGDAAPAGNYKIAITATDPSGNALAVNPVVQGVVTSVDIVNGQPTLNVGGMSLSLSSIVSVGAPPASTNTSTTTTN
jgi:flagellar basal-body rod modification protein FlgD